MNTNVEKLFPLKIQRKADIRKFTEELVNTCQQGCTRFITITTDKFFALLTYVTSTAEKQITFTIIEAT